MMMTTTHFPTTRLICCFFVLLSSSFSLFLVVAVADNNNNNNNNNVALDFRKDFHAIPDDNSDAACKYNSQILTNVLRYNASNHAIRIPYNQTFYLHHGVSASNVNNTRIELDGTLKFQRERKKGNNNSNNGSANTTSSSEEYYVNEHWYDLPHSLFFDRSHNITITTTSVDESVMKEQQRRGIIDGQGSLYWGIPFIGYLEIAEQRPGLLRFNLSSDILIENIILKDSAYHSLHLSGVNNVEIRNISIVARRTHRDGHSFLDLSAFNTDGIDVCGHNIHVHDVDIWNQDDCITITDNYFHDHVSSNMTFERINASGLGFAIGGIGGSTVRNITFRDSYIHKSVKGIYLKFHNPEDYWIERNLTGLIENITFDNIVMESPTQWPIWIGPAQQADARDPCKANPCSLCWPMTPTSKCHVVPTSKYRNISLQNIRINNPHFSPGVLLATDKNPMENILFHNVRVTKGKISPYASNLLETFPGLKQPLHDKYVHGAFHKNNESSRAQLMDIDTVPDDDDDDEDDEASLLQRKKFSAMTIGLIVGSSVLGALLIISLVSYICQWKKARAIRHRHSEQRQLQRRVRFRDLVEVKNSDGTIGNENTAEAAATAAQEARQPLLEQQPNNNNSASPDSFLSEEEMEEELRVSTSFHLNLYHWIGVVALSLTMTAIYIVLVWPFGPDWKHTDQYYKCEGVVNGIAGGKTWPVPYCFDAERKTWWRNLAICIPMDITYGVLGAFLFSALLYYIHVWRGQDHTADTTQLLQQGEEEEDNSPSEPEESPQPQRSSSI